MDCVYSYLAHGTATDYMYEKLHVPLAFTWEIYGDQTASFEDCVKMFNPITKTSFEVGLVHTENCTLQFVRFFLCPVTMHNYFGDWSSFSLAQRYLESPPEIIFMCLSKNVTRQWSRGLFQLMELLPSQPILSRCVFRT